MHRAALAAAACLVLAACGDDDDGAGGGGGGGAAPPAARLELTVHPAGPGGPVRERTIECGRLGPSAEPAACRGLSAERLAPVPRETVCTAVYGGPAVARVTGTIEGRRIDVSFSRENGCEIGRWDRNLALLGPPGRRGG